MKVTHKITGGSTHIKLLQCSGHLYRRFPAKLLLVNFYICILCVFKLHHVPSSQIAHVYMFYGANIKGYFDFCNKSIFFLFMFIVAYKNCYLVFQLIIRI